MYTFFSYENRCPSPDSSGNPCEPGFGSQDCSGEQEVAPKFY
jgi:hypothetical protein